MNPMNRTSDTRSEQPTWMPPVDVIEDAQGIVLLADLPGVSKEQLNLKVDGDQLAIEGEAQWPSAEGLVSRHVEVARKLFRRTFTLSKELDPAGICAELAQGTLRVRIPKAPHAQPRRIDVQVT